MDRRRDGGNAKSEFCHATIGLAGQRGEGLRFNRHAAEEHGICGGVDLDVDAAVAEPSWREEKRQPSRVFIRRHVDQLFARAADIEVWRDELDAQSRRQPLARRRIDWVIDGDRVGHLFNLRGTSPGRPVLEAEPRRIAEPYLHQKVDLTADFGLARCRCVEPP